jgi:hypothetical protein
MLSVLSNFSWLQVTAALVIPEMKILSLPGIDGIMPLCFHFR